MGAARGPTVYFLQRGDDGPVKIGYTGRRARRRRSEAQVGSAEPLHLLAETPGTEAAERALKRRFRAARIRGEWFRPVPELMELVHAIADEGLSLAAYLEGFDDDAG